MAFDLVQTYIVAYLSAKKLLQAKHFPPHPTLPIKIVFLTDWS